MLICNNISKQYPNKLALDNINMEVHQGEFVGIMGPSGSGKTTLLNIIATIDSPTSGEVIINNKQPHTFSPEDLARFRRKDIGIVFQDFNLLHTLTIKENILLPLALEGTSVKLMENLVQTIAMELNITEILNKRTYEVSGGQIQRAAIARAMIHQPKILLADEPTGNLDSKNSRDVMRMLKKLNKNLGVAVILVTHDSKDASYCDHINFIKDGKLETALHKNGTQADFYQAVVQQLAQLEGADNDF